MKNGFWEKNIPLLIIYTVLLIVSFSFLRSEFRKKEQNEISFKSGFVDQKSSLSPNFVDSVEKCDLIKENEDLDQFLRNWEKIILEETLEDIRDHSKSESDLPVHRDSFSITPNNNFQIMIPVVENTKIVSNRKLNSKNIEKKDDLPLLHAFPIMDDQSISAIQPRYRSRFGIRLKPLSHIEQADPDQSDPVDFFDVRYEDRIHEEEIRPNDSVFVNVSMERSKEIVKDPPVDLPDPDQSRSLAKGSRTSVPVKDPITKTYSNKEKDRSKQISLIKPDPKKEIVLPSLENEVWMISSERACSCLSGSECLDYWRLTNGCWNAQNEETFLSGNGRFPATIVFIHGYLTDMQMAVQEGNFLRQRILSLQKKYNIETPFRLVIWKWDSTKTFVRIRRDALSKAWLANRDGQCLATLFSKMDKPERITLIGFSFGARMAGNALQYLVDRPTSGIEYRMILLLAAADYADFSCMGRYGQGIQNLKALMNVYNPRDRVLRLYPKMYGLTGPQAAGIAPLFDVSTFPEGDFSINMSYMGPEHKFSHGLCAIPDSSLIHFIFGDPQ